MEVKRSKVTIRDVAREAGVSVATVSRYLNNNTFISEDKEKKIQEVMERLHFIPNEIARSLAMKKTNTIALIIPDITNPFFPGLVVAIEEIAKQKGYSLILVNSPENDLHDVGFWRSFQNRYIDGLMLASFEFNEVILQEIESLQIPYVRIDRAADSASTNSIGVDHYHGAKLAVDHLVEIGCKKIAHISGPMSFLPAIHRLKGFIDGVKKHYSGEEALVVEGDFTLDSGRKLTESLITEYPSIDGIFLANDLMAIGALKAIKSMGINVPKDIAIIGYDGIELTEMVEPEISTIEQPIYNIGVAATNTLIQLIEMGHHHEDNAIQQNLEVRLIKRESTMGFVGK
jgi:LacI family transcriptional regulator